MAERHPTLERVFATVAAFVVALIVVRHLLDYVSRHGYALFAWWRLIVGAVGLAALLIWG